MKMNKAPASVLAKALTNSRRFREIQLSRIDEALLYTHARMSRANEIMNSFDASQPVYYYSDKKDTFLIQRDRIGWSTRMDSDKHNKNIAISIAASRFVG